jgi:hypothetical protein
MSWQPEVVELPLPPGLPPSGKRFGRATTAAAVGFCTGTLTMETRSCGGRQSGNADDGENDDT